jgi:hypothetical protein
VACTGYRLRRDRRLPPPPERFSDVAGRLAELYIHDDQLGPYLSCSLEALSQCSAGQGVCLHIPAPQGGWRDFRVKYVVTPVPVKVRIPLTRVRQIGKLVAQSVARLVRGASVAFSAQFERADQYMNRAMRLQIADERLWTVVASTPLSRHVGLAMIRIGGREALHVLFDSTEPPGSAAVIDIVALRPCPRRVAAAARGPFREHLSKLVTL